MSSIKEKYLSLLDKEEGEQKYQTFLESNTEFIPRHFVQNHGIHFDLLLRKYKISNDMITDFVILSKSSIGWNYILIEIEKPQSKYFKTGSLTLHSDFQQGINQIKSWQAWFKKPDNKAHFESQLTFLKKPITHTPVSICYVLVTGRRKEYENNEEKINIISSYQDSDFKIMSFDSLAENIKNNNKLYLGVRKQRAVEIRSTELLDTNFLHWCDESDFHLNIELKEKIKASLQKTMDQNLGSDFLQNTKNSQTSGIISKLANMKTTTAKNA